MVVKELSKIAYQRLSNINIILKDTRYSGNIGSVARAMKNMGIKNLIVVNPRSYIEEEALKLAVNADDIISNIKIVSDFKDAISNMELLIGTTEGSRLSPSDTRLKTSRQIVDEIFKFPPDTKIGYIFGSENNGLTNEDMKWCNYIVSIPTSKEYSSINLAQSVMICIYELFISISNIKDEGYQTDSNFAKIEDLYRLYEELGIFLEKIDFLIQKKPKKILDLFKDIFNRAKLRQDESLLLKGIFHKLNIFIDRLPTWNKN